jgi:hypothetical protein
MTSSIPFSYLRVFVQHFAIQLAAESHHDFTRILNPVSVIVIALLDIRLSCLRQLRHRYRHALHRERCQKSMFLDLGSLNRFLFKHYLRNL